MPEYYYSNTSVTTELTGNAGTGDTTIVVASASGYPAQFPYVVALDYETDAEELVLVTAAAGTTWTVTRAFGGTSAQAHSAGAVVKHVVNAVDLQDFRAHQDASAGVHGVTGAVVGTSDTQTLSNKTLTSPVITAAQINGADLDGTLQGNPTLDGAPEFTGAPVFVGGEEFTDAAAFEAATGELALQVRVTGDTAARVQFSADGILAWGDGTAAADTVLYRLSDALLGTTSRIRVIRPSVESDALATRVGEDTNSRFILSADGRMLWGTGAAGADTTLYRSDANLLATDDRFVAQVETMPNPTIASGFTANASVGRRTCGVYYVTVLVTNNVSRPASGAGNIDDVLMCTLPSGWRPPAQTSASWSNGITSGEGRVDESGQMVLRTAMPNSTIGIGTNILCSLSWVG
ncbi:hypothetical protein [Streptomyces johnsoniae]|uniref:Uncharacterized protein n=1 Tax=Streptomyces johnsoniae TaxID=3075532 RepID=A0ABU2RZY1_9ACTN|nr:hypothetical protein [Streptomyces sp. DSM 41886]MDT0442326.1 hypothetical protein [Streptomyces sp. DSM 41886]